jgi:Asp-tRNA(Asn)/Glu-tRNA(Gln) amidotransferase A subunit family amidase
MTDLNAPLTATAALAAMAAGTLSAQDHLQACLTRIAEREPIVQAFAEVDAAEALAVARRLDERGSCGPLHGIPLGFKDIIATAGLATRYNSPIYADNVPAQDASVVALSRVAGGIVLGKTVTCEFANRAPGPTTNPHDPARTPGGSSSGSAAAVAAGMVPLALGTQTSGSVIRPASFCGVHRFKGSWGEISYAGTKLTSGTLDTIGIYARCLDDIALYRAVLTDTRPTKIQRDNVPAPRIGILRTMFASQAGPGSFEALEAVANAAAKGGAKLIDYELPRHFNDLNDAVRWISAWEGARSLAWEKSFRRDQISPDLRFGRIADGEACSPDLYRHNARLAERCRLEFDSVFDEIDVLLTLASPGEAPLGLQHTGSAVFNASFTALHAPCVNLPGHTGPSGMPIGVQLVGKRGTDMRLLDIAAWVERAAFS